MNDLANRLIKHRAKYRLTQKELADRCGVSAQTISCIERGYQKPNKVTLAKIEMVVGGENGTVQHITDQEF